MDKFIKKLVRLVSMESSFISKNYIISGLVLILWIAICIRFSMLERLHRLKTAILRSLYNYDEEDEGPDDEGFIEDDDLFRDLNPEQSVELHRRQRFEAAAAVLENAENKERNERPKKRAPARRRKTIS
ncbi:uncharacterized protein [Drosophila takahashii]|uniref:uncharacterized protein n=1 Tax=Drosophila takahashii TaxID=29030 RepID=UPI001CF80F7E|nr:uncharacterized protein LOC108067449 [Drosophila takahashii]